MRYTGKRMVVWAVVLTLLVSMFAVCGLTLPASAATVLFSENFNSYSNGSLPANWTISSDSGYKTVSVENGGLVINGRGSDAQTRVVYLGSELTNKGDYTFEADYTILEGDYALDVSTRYSSMIYRASASIYPYYYCTTRTKPSQNNELSIRNNSNSSSYKQLALTACPAQFVLNQTYHLKVVCRGANIQFYIDDALVFNHTLETSGANYAYLDKGTIGFTTSNMKVRFDNVVVTEAASVASVQPALYDTYIPSTDIVGAPGVIHHVTSVAEYDELMANATKTPTAALYHLNKDLNITTPDGGTVIASLSSALTKTNKQVIPALYIKDTATADALYAFTKEAALQDAFIVSDSVTLLKYARTKCTNLYGVLYTKLTTAATEKDLQNMVVNTNTGWGKIVMVDDDYITKEDVTYLQKRLMSVWVINDNMDTSGVYNNLHKGIDGIVSTDHGAAIYVLETFNTGKPVLIREPFLYAHRGYSAHTPQNTMPAFQAAVDAGADLIEMDVRNTADGRVVIYHDEFLHTLTDCTDTTKTVENSTYAELMQYNVDCVAGYKEKIPTLEEFLEFLDGTDVVGIIELKNWDAKLTPLVAKIVKDMKMEHQVVSIGFFGLCSELRQQLPGVSCGYLDNAFSSTTPEEVLITSKSRVMTTNMTYHPQLATLGSYTLMENVINVAAARGFSYNPWTYNDAKQFDAAYVGGVQGLTTDYLEFDDGYVRKIVAGACYNLKKGTATAVQALGFTSIGHTLYNCEFVRTGGAAITFSFDSSTGKVTATGTGTSYGYLRYQVQTKNAGSYYVTSGMTIMKVSDTAGTTTATDLFATSLLPGYTAKWKNVINTMNIDVARNDRGDVFTNTTGGYPAVDNACGMYASRSDSIAYEFKADGCISLVIILSDGSSYMLQKYINGASFNGDDLIGNGQTFRGIVKLSDVIPASAATNGQIIISNVRVFNVGDVGDEVVIKQLDLLQNVPSTVLLYGDVNNNGAVQTEDARITLQVALGMQGFTAKQFNAADVDRNGVINTADARDILIDSLI